MDTSLLEADPPMDNKEINAVAGPDVTDQISQSVWEVAHKGGEPYPNVRYMQSEDANMGPEKVHVL